MGSYCSHNSKNLRKIQTNEIVDLPVPKKRISNKVVIVSPPAKKPVPQLKRLQNNPLYKRRRRKSLNDATLSHESTQTLIRNKKRLTTAH